MNSSQNVLKLKAVILLLILSVVYGCWQHFFAEILPIHECRKSDSLTQAIQYFRGASFLEPKTNWISPSANQNAAAEFPLVYFIIGQIWKLTGYHLWIAKLFSVLILIISILSLLPLLQSVLKSDSKLLVFIGFIFSFPALIYYADTLLPNVFSFSFLLLAISFGYRFWQKEEKRAFAIFTIFLSLALLLKITALIAVLSFYGAYTSERLFSKKLRISLQTRKVRLMYAGLLIALGFTFIWYRYAIQYNAHYGSTIFSTTIRPIWEVSIAERWRIAKLVFFEHSREIFPLITWPVFIGIYFWLLWSKHTSTYVKHFLWIGTLGLVAYLILWFWVFEVHDYYFIELLFFPLFLFGAYLYDQPEWKSIKRWKKPLEIIFLALIFLNTLSFTQVAAGNQNVIVKNTPFISSFIKGNWGWFYFNHQETLGQLQKQKKAIQQIVPSNDTVFCFSDPYANVHLTAIDRIGYTNYSLDRNTAFVPQIHKLIQDGAAKLLVLKQDVQHPDLQSFLAYPLYQSGNVQIYDLTPYRK